MTQYFKTQNNEIRKTNIIVFIGVLFGGPLAIYLSDGEDNPIVLISFGLIGALCCVAFYLWRWKAKGIKGLEFSDEYIRIEAKKENIFIKWADLEKAEYYDYGGQQWFFKPKIKKGKIRLILDGFTLEQIETINQIIKEKVTVLDKSTFT